MKQNVYEFTVELYDGVVVRRIAYGLKEFELMCEQLDNDGDVIWWDYEEV